MIDPQVSASTQPIPSASTDAPVVAVIPATAADVGAAVAKVAKVEKAAPAKSAVAKTAATKAPAAKTPVVKKVAAKKPLATTKPVPVKSAAKTAVKAVGKTVSKPAAPKPVVKSTPKPAAKPVAKPVTKPVTKAAPKPIAAPAPVKSAAKPADVKSVVAKQPVAKAPKPAKKVEVAPTPKSQVKSLKLAAKPKEKLVRDSFTMPQADFALIASLKNRALLLKRPTKKSELLRAGLHALQALTSAQLMVALNALVPLKAGRPKRDAD
jgi:hypothetical protein